MFWCKVKKKISGVNNLRHYDIIIQFFNGAITTHNLRSQLIYSKVLPKFYFLLILSVNFVYVCQIISFRKYLIKFSDETYRRNYLNTKPNAPDDLFITQDVLNITNRIKTKSLFVWYHSSWLRFAYLYRIGLKVRKEK